MDTTEICKRMLALGKSVVGKGVNSREKICFISKKNHHDQLGASCQTSDGCKAWSWTREAVGDAPKHKCHHKTKSVAEMERSEVPAVISGEKDCVTGNSYKICFKPFLLYKQV